MLQPCSAITRNTDRSRWNAETIRAGTGRNVRRIDDDVVCVGDHEVGHVHEARFRRLRVGCHEMVGICWVIRTG
jgi:hypothetical protein